MDKRGKWVLQCRWADWAKSSGLACEEAFYPMGVLLAFAPEPEPSARITPD